MGDLLSSRQPLRVLHVEDDLRDAELCRLHLEQAGFSLQAHIVASAEEFGKALQSAPYDVILADYNLPSWSGLDALDTLQREGRDIPFILVTGTLDDETAVECFKKGATDYVVKDRMARLPFAVQRALDEKDAREDRKTAERIRDLLASIVESSDDAIIGMALAGTILTWNRGAERIYGYGPEEVLGKPVSLLFMPDSAGELRQAMEALERGQSRSRHEMLGATNSGGRIHVAVTLSPIRNAGGQVSGASAVIRDITDQKRSQNEIMEAQKMEAVGRLAAGVAHDFNNLLTVVTGYCSMILDQLKEDDPMHREISEVNKAGERAASLTRHLLAFSKKQILQPRVLDLNQIVAEMDRMLRRVIREDIELVTVLDPGLGSVSADPGQIEQVIMNLAVNARDAMPNGGKLVLKTENVDLDETITQWHINVTPGVYVNLSMTDSGSGMDAETQARIFEPFFTTKGHGGTGLGLSMVYGIVQQSGGTILVYSEPGHGTTFKVYLPRVDQAAERAECAAASTPPRGTETILVVEDEDAVRNLIASVLQKQGYTLLLAKNGGEALLVSEQYSGKIDLMVTDVVMPSMGGTELATRMKPLRPDTKVLFMSGYTDSGIVHRGILNPNTAFIEKPFALPALARKVRDTLDAP